MDKFIPVCEPYLNGNELTYVTDAVKTGWISSAGKYVTEFEQQFSEYCGCKYGVAVCNGTVALHLALVALGIGKGDEVILPTYTMIASAFAIIPTFIAAYVFYKDDQEDSVGKGGVSEEIAQPIKGEKIPLSQVKDDAFSQGVLGKGIAIIPSEGKVYAPFDGTVVTLFPTKHAIGIVSDGGCEILIHIGMNTVQLNGKYFKSYIHQGDRVTKGQLLVEFDIEHILQEGYNLETPVIVTNTKDYSDINTNVNDHNIALIAKA